MKIKEIINNSALYLGLGDVREYLVAQTDASEETLKTVGVLTGLCNLVISELASTYIPMTATEEVSAVAGKIFFENLNHAAIKVVSVKDRSGNEINFEVFPEYIKLKDGRFTVEYEYIPQNYGLTDDIGYGEKDVPQAALSYGLCAEYCITQCRFEEAVSWRKRYIFSLEKFLVPKARTMKARMFV